LSPSLTDKPRIPLSPSFPTTQLPLCSQKDDATDAESIQYIPAQIAPEPSEEQLDKQDDPIHLLTNPPDADMRSSNQHRWTRSKIHIFKVLKSRKIRICSQNEYIGRETIGTTPFPFPVLYVFLTETVDPETDEIVFWGRPLVLWLRRCDEILASFSTSANEIGGALRAPKPEMVAQLTMTDMMYFSTFLTKDELETYFS
jgi:hypothetical protein